MTWTLAGVRTRLVFLWWLEIYLSFFWPLLVVGFLAFRMSPPFGWLVMCMISCGFEARLRSLPTRPIFEGSHSC